MNRCFAIFLVIFSATLTLFGQEKSHRNISTSLGLEFGLAKNNICSEQEYNQYENRETLQGIILGIAYRIDHLEGPFSLHFGIKYQEKGRKGDQYREPVNADQIIVPAEVSLNIPTVRQIDINLIIGIALSINLEKELKAFEEIEAVTYNRRAGVGISWRINNEYTLMGTFLVTQDNATYRASVGKIPGHPIDATFVNQSRELGLKVLKRI